MKARRGWLLLLAGLGLAAALGFLLREIVRTYLVLPLTKFFWLIRGYYGAFSQASYFIILLVVVVLIGLVSFRLMDWIEIGRRRDERPRRGAVRQMTFWLERSQRSAYARWYVARSLADLALDLLGGRAGSRRRDQDLAGAGWDPPPEIQEYLESALRLSPAGFARNEPSSPQVAALEYDPERVVAYLESILESIHDHSHS